MLRVLVVYEGELGDALEGSLRGEALVSRARSVLEALSADTGAFDVLAIQRHLADGDGLALAEAAKAGGFTGTILLVASGSPSADLVDALRRGVDDYAREPLAVEELVARVHALGRRAARSLRLVVGPLCLDTLARRVFLHGKALSTFTRREIDVLEVLARDPGWTTTAELARLLFTRTDDAVNHVQVTISRIRGKLGKEARMLENRRGIGYRLRVVPPEEASERKPRGTLST